MTGLEVLAGILKRLRWDNQGGYPSYMGDGKWSFVSTSLPQTTPEELNALFKLVGIEPDVIVSKGPCEDCAHARLIVSGKFVIFRERGYETPCSSCKRPRMSNFEPAKSRPSNRRFWCRECGDLFSDRDARDKHVKAHK